MKRFGFDWENNRALKFDDHFKFPLVLNMEPYTMDGVNKRENFAEHDELAAAKGASSTGPLFNSSATTTASGGIALHFDVHFPIEDNHSS